MNPHITIASYLFDPCSDVGALRWSRLGRELLGTGLRIRVLTSNYKGWNTSPVSGDEIEKHVFPARYPMALDQAPASLFDRINYRLQLIVRKAVVRGTPYDKAALIKRPFLTRMEAAYRDGCRVFIVTGAPFNMCYYGALFKSRHPDVFLVTDFRDPWTWGGGYGFRSLTHRSQQWEREKEAFVMQQSDVITVPVEPMLHHLQQHYPVAAVKCHWLSHGYDAQKIARAMNVPSPPAKDRSCRVVYGGTIYQGVGEVLEKMDALMEQHRATFHYDLFALNHAEIRSDFRHIAIHARISEEALFAQIRSADAYLAIYPEAFKDFISTKFMEIIALKRPIVLLAPKGHLSDFLVANSLGAHFTPDQLPEMIDYVFNRGFEGLVGVESYPVEAFSFPAISRQLLAILPDEYL